MKNAPMETLLLSCLANRAPAVNGKRRAVARLFRSVKLRF